MRIIAVLAPTPDAFNDLLRSLNDGNYRQFLLVTDEKQVRGMNLAGVLILPGFFDNDLETAVRRRMR